MGQIKVNLRLAACGTAELVRGKGGLEILKTMRGVVEVRDGLGQLTGIEPGQEILEVAECPAGLTEYIWIRHEIVRHGVLDEFVYTPRTAINLFPRCAGSGGHDIQCLLAPSFEGRSN